MAGALNISLHSEVARKHGYYAAILYTFLQKEQWEHRNYNDAANTRQGIKWIMSLSVETIQRDLPIFPDAKTVSRAADELEKAGLIRRESTGAFLSPDHHTGRKRDIASWWHVSREHVPMPNVPEGYFEEDKLMRFSSAVAKEQGISAALILGYWEKMPVDLEEGRLNYKLLTATTIEKALPMDERTARRQIRKLVASGKLLRHSERKKLYAAG